MKKNGVLLIGALILTGILLAGCSSAPSSNSNSNNGILSIRNLPAGNCMVAVSDYGPITSQESLIKAAALPLARGSRNASPLILTDSRNGGTFSASGSYTVIITTGLNKRYKTGVSFKNGAATLDYNSMTDAASLPASLP